jgi:putative sigma-54 modulation protein
MEITIESLHFTLSEHLNNFIHEKVNKLTHLNERLIMSEVSLKISKSATEENKLCEIKVLGPHVDLFASHHAATFEDAITETVHALEEQLRKSKTKKEKGHDKIEIEDSTEAESETEE